MKTLLITLLTLSALPSFAQGNGGISGPDTSGNKVNSDEKVLTRTDLKKVLDQCGEVEVFELTQVLSKNFNLKKNTESTGNGSYLNNFPIGIYDEAYSIVLQYIDDNKNTIAGSMRIYGSRIGIEVNQFGHNNEGLNKYLSFTTEIGLSLNCKQSKLDDNYDEYGNVIENKTVISNISWEQSEDLIQLLNYTTKRPIKDIFFNAKRFKECVNLGIGKYTK